MCIRDSLKPPFLICFWAKKTPSGICSVNEPLPCLLYTSFLKSCHPAFLADTEHSALCCMIGNLLGIYAQALGVIGIETVNPVSYTHLDVYKRQMYVYKPMAGHNLMQAIARVNRVFKDKEGGFDVP